VDTSKVEQDITTYAPAGSDPPVSIHQIYEQYGAGSTSGACGIPGTNSNVPGLSSYPGVCTDTGATTTAAPSASPNAAASSSPGASPNAAASATADAGSTSSGGYLHQETTVNYSVSQTVQHVITQPGVVKRLSVAVLIDQAALGSVKTETLKTDIAAAIGADTTRGDVVAVDAVTFAARPTGAAGAAGAAGASGAAGSASASPDMMKTIGDMSGTILGAAFGLFMLLLFFLNTRSLGRRADETVLDLGSVPAAGNYLTAPTRSNAPAIGAPEAAPAEMPGATPQARIQERLQMVADERPEALAGLMHGWLREEERRR
jgi:flagellar M-ring protein FliF